MLKSKLRCWVKRLWSYGWSIRRYQIITHPFLWKEKKILAMKWLLHTQRAPVWTGPYPLIAVYSLKYWGMDKPRKTEKPKMNLVLKLFKLQNWRKLKPPAPTYAKKRQYKAAMMGAGIEANTAPNFPAQYYGSSVHINISNNFFFLVK